VSTAVLLQWLPTSLTFPQGRLLIPRGMWNGGDAAAVEVQRCRPVSGILFARSIGTVAHPSETPTGPPRAHRVRTSAPVARNGVVTLRTSTLVEIVRNTSPYGMFVSFLAHTSPICRSAFCANIRHSILLFSITSSKSSMRTFLVSLLPCLSSSSIYASLWVSNTFVFVHLLQYICADLRDPPSP